jgi:hypothetical protein
MPYVPLKTGPGAQNMKTGPDARGTAENESGGTKYENGSRRPRFRRKRVRERKTRKRDTTPPVLSKMSSGAQNKKTVSVALGIVENESGSAKHENGTRRPRYRRKRVRGRNTLKRYPMPYVPPKTSPGAQNMKTGPDTLVTVENETGRAKHENETRRPRYR